MGIHMDSQTQIDNTSLINFTPTAETRALIEAASEHTDIDSFINSCIAMFDEAHNQ